MMPPMAKSEESKSSNITEGLHRVPISVCLCVCWVREITAAEDEKRVEEWGTPQSEKI